MDFNDTPEQAKFRARCREWLEANAELKESKGSGSNVPRSGEPSLADHLKVAKAWQKKKYDAGWAMLHWPKEYGALKLRLSKELFGGKKKQNMMFQEAYLKLVLVCVVR
jgi:alkylation response protein AidB-like acyl-CoA dehydrogenase